MTMFTRATTAPSRSSLRRLIVGRPLTAYFALAYTLTWALVLPMTLSANYGVGLLPYDLPDAVGLALFVLASFIGPSVAAIIVTALAQIALTAQGQPRILYEQGAGPATYIYAACDAGCTSPTRWTHTPTFSRAAINTGFMFDYRPQHFALDPRAARA